jgi:hypothetical protein
MARWMRRQTKTYEDLPKRLRSQEGEPRSKVIERHWWLERHGLDLVGYLAWERAQRGPHVPSRRKLMSEQELIEFDARRDKEGDPGW